MATELLIHNVKPLRGSPTDLLIRDGVFAEVGPDLQADTTEVIDGRGKLLFPGLVDAHTHMDKTLIGLGWYRNEVGPTLLNKIDNERNLRLDRNIDMHQQTTRHAEIAVATGTTHIRSFVDIDTDGKLSGFEGLLKTREDFRDALDIQIVAFPQSGMLVRPGTVELMDTALANGADLVGGLDPSSIDRDPKGHLDTIFALAEKHDVDIDIHLHEPGELGAFDLEMIAERTKILGWKGRVVVSHAFCLAGTKGSRVDQLIELVLENDIAIMSHGPGGLTPAPSVARLRAAGVRMCTGNDGIRDSWSPLNMPDMLLRIFIIAYRNNLRADTAIEDVVDIATYGGADVIGDQQYGLLPGCNADFVLVDGETHVEAIINRPPRSMVFKRGKLVGENGVCLVGGNA